MNTHGHTHDRPLEHHAEHPYLLVICVALASFIVGAIPITISNHLDSSNPDSAPLILGEAGLWNALGR
ncbi:MAG: hypothetical protein J7647_15890 [Cyanobacteria bacterium SBLK]|nr:hypothetical protein [Cyanobacteria bacterium SBLK]